MVIVAAQQRLSVSKGHFSSQSGFLIMIGALRYSRFLDTLSSRLTGPLLSLISFGGRDRWQQSAIFMSTYSEAFYSNVTRPPSMAPRCRLTESPQELGASQYDYIFR